MIKEAIQYVVGLAPANRMELLGRAYTDKPVHPVYEPEAKYIEVFSLTGFVDYVNTNVDALDLEKILVHVVGPKKVQLVSALYGDFRQRETLIVADADTPYHQFDEWLASEEFIIWLQSSFAKDNLPFDMDMLTDDATAPEGGFGLMALLSLTSSMKTDEGGQVNDDGVSQSVVARQGLRLANNAKVPNPVTLRPFRTFTEVDQPASDFVFRVNQQLRCKLVEADGGAWRSVAMKSIQVYLEEKLPDKVQVIA